MYDPTREWDIAETALTLPNDNGHFLYLKVPTADDVTTSEIIASENHVDPLFYDGYIVYKMGYINAVVDGRREVSMLWGNVKRPAPSWAGLPDYQEFEFQNVVTGAQSWDLHIKPTFGYTIESISLETDTGTITGVSVLINATTITGLSGITVDTAVDTTSSTALKTVVPGNRITLSKTGESGVPTIIKGQINYIRT